MDTSDPIDRCFNLAWFIVPDKDAALSATRDALLTFDVSQSVQDRRIKRGSRTQNKVRLGTEHLLQVVLLRKTESYERTHEVTHRPSPVTDDDLLVRWFKHAIEGASDNSFHTTIALCRILHHYSTAQARNVYEFLVQDPSLGKDDDQYRRVKSRLHARMEQRFEGWVDGHRAARGEETFTCRPQTAHGIALAAECLERFSPWGTGPAVLPVRFDPTADIIRELLSVPGQSDDVDAVEARRMATLLRPRSLERVARLLRMSEPSERLLLPVFHIKGHDEMDDPPKRSAPPALDAAERDGISGFLDHQRRERQEFHPNHFTVVIDAREPLPLRLQDTGTIAFSIDASDRLIEIYGHAGTRSVLLAAHVIVKDADGAIDAGSLRFGGNAWNLALSFEPGTPARATLSYDTTSQGATARNTGWIRALQDTSAWAYRLRELDRPGASSAAGVCPSCGGVLLDAPSSDEPSGWRVRRCDRCPFVSTSQS